MRQGKHIGVALTQRGGGETAREKAPRLGTQAGGVRSGGSHSARGVRFPGSAGKFFRRSTFWNVEYSPYVVTG